MLSNNKGIQKLNKKFRNKNKPTDILSFPLNTKIKINNKIYLGDIIITIILWTNLKIKNRFF